MEIVQENEQYKEVMDDDEQSSDNSNRSKLSGGFDNLRSSVQCTDHQLTLRFEDLEDDDRGQ